jgi:hypothetical protein
LRSSPLKPEEREMTYSIRNVALDFKIWNMYNLVVVMILQVLEMKEEVWMQMKRQKINFILLKKMPKMNSTYLLTLLNHKINSVIQSLTAFQESLRRSRLNRPKKWICR